MVNVLSKILGDSTDRAVKKLAPIVKEINDLEPGLERLDDEALRRKTDEFRARLSKGEDLDDLLPEAFGVVREAAKRTLGQRHYDVQLMGGIILHQGKVAEMKTGEGKTLVATLPAYLNAITGEGVHVVTVNDYLARRDSSWMGPVFHKLGLRVACLQHESALLFDSSYEGPEPSQNHVVGVSRQEAYSAHITYGTNNEFGFDYLRDNMALTEESIVQRGHHYAIVDEVDNILIDEARTPLIISGPAEEPVQLYYTFAKLVPRLKEDDYTIDDRTQAISLTQSGISNMERWAKVGNLYDAENYHLVHFIENALTAQVMRKRDKDYVVRDGEVVIVDEFTGRLQFGRRWSDGLHQAVEAKEGVKIQRESITYATVTLQNYFRIYDKLAGMTGTALTESEEFYKIYGFDVAVIPTNKPMVRDDRPDLIFKTEEGKWNAVSQEIKEHYDRRQPVLVGTTSIEKSEKLSAMLRRSGIPHNLLNAKQHEDEAQIVAQAGRPGAVTVATNMAGRGTDIVLGGNPDNLEMGHDQWQADHEEVVARGGLHVIGTEHHDSRRIDNQLRGRSGRQGDPGSSRFYASLEDDLMRRFGGDRIKGLMGLVGLGDDTPLENRMVTKSLEGAQVKVEGHHFETRKHLLEYDDVLNNQRQVIYTKRRESIVSDDLEHTILAMVQQKVVELVKYCLPGKEHDDWDTEGFLEELRVALPLPADLDSEEELLQLDRQKIEERLLEHAQHVYGQRKETMGPENMKAMEKLLMLRSIDVHWVSHLTSMNNLRQGIGLHAFGQRDPLVMYKTEGSRMFQELLKRIDRDVVHSINYASISTTPGTRPTNGSIKPSPMKAVASSSQGAAAAVATRKVGRNDPCPCGSNKKYKRCHGSNG
ncbi:MAG: preprotein translocase subunit SecA [Dehalococcoidia bacterium]|nr:preprotein translocase subunit SecA [Dehalococcoidia bacterium]